MKTLLIGLIVILVMNLGLRVHYMAIPLDSDEGAYAYIGKMWTEGKLVPYKDVFDHKGPGVYLVYGMGMKWWGNNTYGVRMTALVWSAIAAITYYCLFVRLLGKKVGWIVMVVWVIFQSWGEGVGMRFGPESISLLPMGIYLNLLLKKEKKLGWQESAILGLTGCAIGLIKAAGLIFLAPVSMIVYLGKQKRWVWPAAIAGAMGLVILTGIYFGGKGALGDLREMMINYNERYVSLSLSKSNFCEGQLSLCLVSLVLFPGGVELIPLLVVSTAGIAELVRRGERKNFAIWGMMLAAGFLYIRLAGWRFYSYYQMFMLIPELYLFGRVEKYLLEKRKMLPIGIMIIASILGWYGVWSYLGPKLQGKAKQNGDVDVATIVNIIKQKEISRVFVFANEPEIYVEANLTAMDSYINTFYFRGNDEGLRQWWKNSMSRQPEMIVRYTTVWSKQMLEPVERQDVPKSYSVCMKGYYLEAFCLNDGA